MPPKKFSGEEVDVSWDGRLCIHIEECGRAKGGVFEQDRSPWCVPSEGSADEVVEIVERCPSGALTYSRNDDGPEEEPLDENMIVVSNNGPLFVVGDLQIDTGTGTDAGGQGDQAGTRFRAALCRCGKSKNKPFCDNSHEAAGFRDTGAIGELGTGSEDIGGPLEISPAKNGPLLVNGNVSIVTAAGRLGWTGTKVALCRCGESKNKPFCDGSHKAAGFEAP